MEMKRNSFVCLGQAGGRDSLVYQEIPGRDGGEEFFLFFAPGAPREEELLRTMFREAVSASRLGSPLNYFARAMERFALAMPPGALGDDPLENALLMIEIRRGEDSYLFCNGGAELLHWNGKTNAFEPLEEVPGFRKIPLGGEAGQRDLFDRSPEEYFSLYRFETSGIHTLALLPSREFAGRHAETLRDSIFFPSFEFPGGAGLSLPVERSFPVLHWRGEEGARSRTSDRVGALPRFARRLPAAAGAVGVIALVLILVFRGAGERAAVPANRAQLAAADEPREAETELEAASRPAGGTERRAGATISESWKRSFAAPVTSSPRLADGTVYFGSRDGHLYAFDRSGELRWKYRASGGIGASALAREGRIVCADYRGELFSLDARNGRPIWKLALGAKVVSSPVAMDGAVYAATTDGRVVAAREQDGKRLWEKKIGASIRATPAVGPGWLVAATTDGALVKLDAAGKVIWRVSIGGEILSSPLFVEEKGIVVVGAQNRSIQARSLATGELVWKAAADAPVNGSPALADGSIYVGTRGGTVYALGLDGAELWRAKAGGAILSKPAVAEGSVFVTTYGSQLVVFSASTGAVLDRYQTDSSIYSSPAVDGSRVYFGSNGGRFFALWLRPTA